MPRAVPTISFSNIIAAFARQQAGGGGNSAKSAKKPKRNSTYFFSEKPERKKGKKIQKGESSLCFMCHFLSLASSYTQWGEINRRKENDKKEPKKEETSSKRETREKERGSNCSFPLLSFSNSLSSSSSSSSPSSFHRSLSLLQFLLGAELVGVAALLLAAVGRARVEAGVAPVFFFSSFFFRR